MPLPPQLIQFISSDKEWHDKELDMKDYANTPSPLFIVISGPTNCGKSSLRRNLIVHKNKPYTHICDFSLLGEDSTEYSDCIDCEMITDVRDANFDRNDRNLLIVEDCDIKYMN